MRFIVSGHSMVSTFKPGQTLLVSSIPYIFRKPKIGDVVIIKDRRDGRLLLKRIKKIDGQNFFISGDNAHHSRDSRAFGSLSASEILGKVIDK